MWPAPPLPKRRPKRGQGGNAADARPRGRAWISTTAQSWAFSAGVLGCFTPSGAKSNELSLEFARTRLSAYGFNGERPHCDRPFVAAFVAPCRRRQRLRQRFRRTHLPRPPLPICPELAAGRPTIYVYTTGRGPINVSDYVVLCL